jgi:hypothetical protein
VIGGPAYEKLRSDEEKTQQKSEHICLSRFTMSDYFVEECKCVQKICKFFFSFFLINRRRSKFNNILHPHGNIYGLFFPFFGKNKVK